MCDGSLSFRGSFAVFGALVDIDSLSASETLFCHGSLSRLVAYGIVDSLFYLVAFCINGLTLLIGTHSDVGSFGRFGFLAGFGSLMSSGTLGQRDSLSQYGALGSVDSLDPHGSSLGR